MEPRYLLDTNICIYIRQKRPEEVLRRFRKLRPGEAVLSVITYGELLYGAAKSEQRFRAIEQLHELVSAASTLAARSGRRSLRNDPCRTRIEWQDDRKQRSMDRRACTGRPFDSSHKPGNKQLKRIPTR